MFPRLTQLRNLAALSVLTGLTFPGLKHIKINLKMDESKFDIYLHI